MAEDRFDVDPRGSGHEADQEPPEAQPVWDPGPVTSKRVGLIGRWEQGFDGGEQDVHDVGLERAHDVGDLHTVVGSGQALASNASRPDNRWMVTYPRGSLAG